MKLSLLILADDLTGAMDTGVKFSARGISSSVVPIFREDIFDAPPEVRVLIVNTESRHLPPKDAYKRVYTLAAAAKAAGTAHIYKKTDSALRGNLGAELSALLEAAGASFLPFIPAYPVMNRVTKDGTHWIDGVPVSESVLGRDPFTPVPESYVPRLLSLQSTLPTLVSQAGARPTGITTPSIVVFDAQTDEDLQRTGMALSTNPTGISAGCAGFADVLPQLLGLPAQTAQKPPVHQHTFTVCGSVSPITIEQLVTARNEGTPVFEADDAIIDDGFGSSETADCLLTRLADALAHQKRAVLASALGADTLARRDARLQADGCPDHLRVNIAKNLGLLTQRLLSICEPLNLVVFGGDTVAEIIRALDVRRITPALELVPGVVLAQADSAAGALTLITKSGGFGAPDVMARIDAFLSSP